ncbi:MAG TPA: M23 family metallopeptidase [Candidatus Binataceae bacterium]|nr:M23 family metallopeptidase [Candidatus Binataceae bacterium]
MSLRILTGLIVGIAATVAALVVYIQPNPDTFGSPLAEFDAGRNQPIIFGDSESIDPAPPAIMISTTLDRTASIESYLRDAGLDEEAAAQWASYFEGLTADRDLHSGHPFTIYKDPATGELRGFRYDLSYKSSIIEAHLGSGVIKAAVTPIEYIERPVKSSFTITDSFQRAAANNGIPRPIIATLQDAFGDRHNLDHLAPGSAVKLIYREKVSRDGTYRLAEGVEAAQISFGSRTLKAYAFEDEEGRAHLYDEEGRVLGPQALRFPVNFKYISSGFTFHRYHPLLHEYRPHVGVDLVARYGEPVMAVADGRVQSAGWQGELGNCVRIQHPHGVVSIYGHLSSIGVHQGAYVRVGQFIGRVGSTGLSTGPHLHFAIEKGGSYVNPLLQHLGENHPPVSPRMQVLFDEMKQHYESALSEIPDISPKLADAATVVAKPIAAHHAAPSYHVSMRTITEPTHRHRHRHTLRLSSRMNSSYDGSTATTGGL